jgi:hypothetical protein
MIDSHSTASLVNIEDDDQINDLDNPDVDEGEEDEEFLNLNAHIASSINKGNGVSLNYKNNSNVNNQRKFQQLVELEDDEEKNTDNTEKRKGSYITEIETINLDKTNSNRNINEIKINNNIENSCGSKIKISADMDTNYSQPLSKKFKRFNTDEINNLQITSEKNENNLQQVNYLYSNNTLDLKVFRLYLFFILV